MRIAVFGRGHVGAALGHALSGAGHEVRYGVRDPAEAEGPGVVALTEAAEWGEVLILGVPYGVVDEVLQAAGDLDGKIIVDPTNAPKPPTDERSSTQIIASFVPTARVVRAFNTVPAEVMVKSALRGWGTGLHLRLRGRPPRPDHGVQAGERHRVRRRGCRAAEVGLHHRPPAGGVAHVGLRLGPWAQPRLPAPPEVTYFAATPADL